MTECHPEGVSLFAEWATRETCLVFILADGTSQEFRTSRGVDQGCPGSPVLFALGMHRALTRVRNRFEEWARSVRDDAVRAVQVARLLSFLDDLSCLAAPVVAPAASRRSRSSWPRWALK